MPTLVHNTDGVRVDEVGGVTERGGAPFLDVSLEEQWDRVSGLWRQQGSYASSDAGQVIESLIHEWRSLGGRGVLTSEQVLADFADEIRRDGSRDRCVPLPAYADRVLKGIKRGQTPQEVVGLAIQQLLACVRPWYPLWHDFVAHVVNHSHAHKIDSITFLARDSLLFYYLAAGIAAHRNIPRCSVRHVSRSRKNSSVSVDLDHRRATAGSERVAIVDSGCYGTVVDAIIRKEYLPNNLELPHVFFLYSRNANIFGYLNYLVATSAFPLRSAAATREFQELLSVPAVALDTIESLPKPYSVHEEPALHLSTNSLLSFCLSQVLYRDLFSYAELQEREMHQSHNAGSSLELMSQISGQIHRPQSQACSRDVFFVPSATKWPKGKDWLRNWNLGTLPPQQEIFGVEHG